MALRAGERRAISHALCFGPFRLCPDGIPPRKLPRNPWLFRRWFGWQTLAALPTGLYILAFLLRRQPLTGNAWIPKIGVLAPMRTLLNFLSADGDQLTWLGILAALAGVMVFAAGLRPCGAAGSRGASARPLFLSWLFLPLLLSSLFF